MKNRGIRPDSVASRRLKARLKGAQGLRHAYPGQSGFDKLSLAWRRLLTGSGLRILQKVNFLRAAIMARARGGGTFRPHFSGEESVGNA